MPSTLRIFWPVDVVELERQTEYQPSLIIGWKNGNTDYVVVTTLPFLDPNLVDSLLLRDDLLSGSKHPSPDIYQLCGQKRMSILGTLNYKGTSSWPKINIEAVLDDSLKYPSHRFTQGSPMSIQIIAFDPPKSHRMQYFSVSPITLALSEKGTSAVINEEYEATLVSNSRNRAIMVQNIYRHISVQNSISGQLINEHLNKCIAQINCCLEVGEIMRKNAAVAFPNLRERRRRLSVSQTALKSAKSVHNRFHRHFSIFWNYFAPLLLRILISLITFFRLISEFILTIIEWTPSSNFLALKDVSATAQQIDLRLQQFCHWPIQYIMIRKRSKNWASNTNFNLDYIRYYNSIWLVVNDIILGVAVGGLILENRERIIDSIDFVIDEILTNRFKSNMLWLMDWPGGLKLNNELAAFFGELFLWVVHIWSEFLNLFRPYLGYVVYFIGISGFAGATLSISLISDCLSLLNLHVYSFYVASARIYHWQLIVLRSLFHLFRGKKHNVLRNRIDSVHYELDQLLMGTIFFTVLLFLLPTVLVFYLFFAFGRLTTVTCCAVLEFILMCLNHFPLFAILLRLKDYQRIPGGIRMIPVLSNKNYGWWDSISNWNTKPKANEALQNQSLVLLEPVPLGFRSIFHQYYTVSQRLRFHYFSSGVFKRILTGQFVPIQRSKLYGLLYSMLPDQRIGVQQLYTELQNLYQEM